MNKSAFRYTDKESGKWPKVKNRRDNTKGILGEDGKSYPIIN